MNWIEPGNSVWFHDHAEDMPCTPNCYAHVDTPRSDPESFWSAKGAGMNVLYCLDPSAHENHVWEKSWCPGRTAPIRYFLRINGMLREVYPITKASKDNRGTVLVEVSRTGEVLRVGNGSLILHY